MKFMRKSMALLLVLVMLLSVMPVSAFAGAVDLGETAEVTEETQVTEPQPTEPEPAQTEATEPQPTEPDPTEVTEPAPDNSENDNSRVISFDGATYQDEALVYHYVIEAQVGDTVTLHPTLSYSGPEKLSYQWMRWDANEDKYVELALSENVGAKSDRLTIYVTEEDASLDAPYLCMVFGDTVQGTVVFEIKTPPIGTESIDGEIRKAASYSYNANAALAYAAAHWNDGVGACAEFVYNCLAAGGLAITRDTGTGTLLRKIESATGLSAQDLQLDSAGNPSKGLNESILSAGDPVFVWCYTHNISPHVVLSNGYNSNGKMVQYAHNSAKDGSAVAYFNRGSYYPAGGEHSDSCRFGAKVIHLGSTGSGSGGSYTEAPWATFGNNLTLPTHQALNGNFALWGSITVPYGTIKSVWGAIYHAETATIVVTAQGKKLQASASVNSASYEIHSGSINNDLTFGSLAEGNYIYVINVVTEYNGKTADRNYVYQMFTVGGVLGHRFRTTYELNHPHSEYDECICGAREETGRTRYIESCQICNPPHVHSYTTNFEAAHPHREYRKCSCGDWEYTGTNHSYYAACEICNPAPELIYLDLNFYLDDIENGSIKNYGTCDVYINGQCVADDVSDFYQAYPAGTAYEIRDIRFNRGYRYGGASGGELSGVINSHTIISLKFYTDPPVAWLSESSIKLDLVSLPSVVLQYSYSGDTPNGYHLHFESSDGSVADFADAEGDAITVMAVNPGTATISMSLEEDGTGQILDTARCTVTVAASGICGNGLTWLLDANHKLTVSGTGAMNDYSYKGAPWYAYRDQIFEAVLEDGVTTVGIFAFDSCPNLTYASMPGVKKISQLAFQLCSSLESVYMPVVEHIEFLAFNASGLTELIIPASLTTFETPVSFSNDSLQEIKVSEGNKTYCIKDGMLYTKDGKNLLLYPGGKPGDVSVPNGTTIIECAAFEGSCGLTSVILPDGVTIIGDHAFGSCQNLKAVTIPESVTSIGECAFECTGLTEVTIPAGVAKIGEYAFGYISYIDANTNVKVPNFTIRGFTGSAAETYAKNNGFTFVSLGALPGDDVRQVEITAPADHLTSGQSMQLTASILPENSAGDKILWSVAPEDTAFAAISSTGLLTAKTVTELHTVTVNAKTAKNTAAPAQLQVQIVPAVSKVTIFRGSEDCTGKTVNVDVGRINTVTFSAVCLPEGCDTAVTWKTSDPQGLNSSFTDNGDGSCTVSNLHLTRDAAASITLSVTSSNGKSAAVRLNLTAAPRNISIGGIPDSGFLRGGETLTLTPIFSDFVSDSAVRWSVSGPEGVKISSTGVLTTPVVKTQTDVEVTVRAANALGVSCTQTITLCPTTVQSIIMLNGQQVTAVTMNLAESNTLTFGACNLPSGANQTGTWSLSPAKGASFDSGILRVDKPGTYTLKFTAADGSRKSASVKITAVMPVTSLSLSGIYGLVSGTSGALKAQINADATNKKLVWSSSDPNVATVSASGSVKAQNVYEQKTVTITARAADGFGAEDSVTLTVYPKNNVLGIRNADGEIVNETTIFVDASVRQINLSAWSGTVQDNGAAWKVSGKNVASQGGGVFSVLSTGTVTITASNAAKQSGKVKLTVCNQVKGLMVTPNLSTLACGVQDGSRIVLASGKGKISLVGTISNANATYKTLKWTSDDPLTAAVSSSGVVTAKAGVQQAKTVTITASAADGSGISKSVTLTVVPLVQSITLTNPDGVLTGNPDAALNGSTIVVPLEALQNVQLSAQIEGSAAIQKVTWKTSSAAIATVSNGVVSGLKRGTVTITVAAADGSGKTASVKLTIV